jgi:23S rRNA (adenine2503-C2)-methyltransferase
MTELLTIARPRRPILGLSDAELAGWLAEQGEPAYRARQLRRAVASGRVQSFDAISDLPAGLRAALAESFALFGSHVELVRRTADDTQKMLVRLDDGAAIECVLMAEQSRRTVCVSTQVGCAMACAFCASGLDGVRRNLRADEILEQYLHAAQRLPPGERLTHSVVMGMGEPLANLDNLLAALDRVTAREGLGLSRRHITVSTVGLPAQIRRLAESGRGYQLAVSLHAPDDALRNRLVPPNARIGIARVLEAADEYQERTGRQVTYEYVLLRDVNDQPDQAQRLAHLLAPRHAHVNLIPYNPVSGLAYETPRSEQVHRFAELLRRAGLVVHVRKTKGRRIGAACGQLRLQQAN